MKVKTFEIKIENLGFVEWKIINEKKLYKLLYKINEKYKIVEIIKRIDQKKEIFENVMSFITFSFLNDKKIEMLPDFCTDNSILSVLHAQKFIPFYKEFVCLYYIDNVVLSNEYRGDYGEEMFFK